MVAQLNVSTKTHHTAHLEWLNFVVCKLNLNKAVKHIHTLK